MAGTELTSLSSSSPSTRRALLSNQNAATVSPSVSDRSKADHRNARKKKRYQGDVGRHHAQVKSEFELIPPLSTDDHRTLAKRTKRLIKRRNTLDRELLRAADKTKPEIDDFDFRHKLLRSCKKLKRREQQYLERCEKQQFELEKLYIQDCSLDRAFDYDLVRKLLWRFKRNLGPLLDEYTDRRIKKESEETNSPGSYTLSEWSDIPDSEDETGKHSKLSSRRKQNGAREHAVLSLKQTTAPLDDTPVVAQPVGVKIKREVDVDDSPKKVRFALGEDLAVSPVPGGGKSKKKAKKLREMSTETSRTNDK